MECSGRGYKCTPVSSAMDDSWSTEALPGIIQVPALVCVGGGLLWCCPDEDTCPKSSSAAVTGLQCKLMCCPDEEIFCRQRVDTTSVRVGTILRVVATGVGWGGYLAKDLGTAIDHSANVIGVD